MNRPDHTDFWYLSQAAIDNDHLADNAGPDDDLFSDNFVDNDSAMYLMEQRLAKSSQAIRAAARGRLDPEVFTRASWIDGLMLGIAFERLRASRSQEWKED